MYRTKHNADLIWPTVSLLSQPVKRQPLQVHHRQNSFDYIQLLRPIKKKSKQQTWPKDFLSSTKRPESYNLTTLFPFGKTLHSTNWTVDMSTKNNRKKSPNIKSPTQLIKLDLGLSSKICIFIKRPKENLGRKDFWGGRFASIRPLHIIVLFI